VLLPGLLATEAKPMDFSFVSSWADAWGVFNKRGLVVGDCRAAGPSWGRYPGGLLEGRLLVEEGLVGWFFLFEQAVTFARVFWLKSSLAGRRSMWKGTNNS
jgi:hypothetical protein